MSKVLQRGTAMLAVLIASVVFATTALAQMPTSPWKKGAPFPEADEELYGVTLERQTLRVWRLGRRQGARRRLRVRPDHRQVDEEDVDAAAGPPCGAGRCERQDLRDGRLRPARRTPPSPWAAPGNPLTARGSTTRRRIPGSRCRRCPASADPRSPRKSAARST